jgi:hypothetical protein
MELCFDKLDAILSSDSQRMMNDDCLLNGSLRVGEDKTVSFGHRRLE